MITAWDKVKIAETDDISKLLAGRKSAIRLIRRANDCRGIKLEYGSGRCVKAGHGTTSEEEEACDKSTQDHQHSYERAGKWLMPLISRNGTD
jgi:hypothetical protein